MPHDWWFSIFDSRWIFYNDVNEIIAINYFLISYLNSRYFLLEKREKFLLHHFPSFKEKATFIIKKMSKSGVTLETIETFILFEIIYGNIREKRKEKKFLLKLKFFIFFSSLFSLLRPTEWNFFLILSLFSPS